jgi:LPXTG-motif cell wall-anchored protein
LRNRIRGCAAALGIALALALPGAAAASPRTHQYQNPISNEKPASHTTGGVAAATASKSGGTLPFTGVELGGIVIVGLALLGGGGILAVRARRDG